MIEYSVSFMDIVAKPNAIKTVRACFLPDAVEVSITNMAQLTPTEWNNCSLLLLDIKHKTHRQWPMIYTGTPIAADLQSAVMTTPTIMAFGALHVFVPDYRTAQHFEANPHLICKWHLDDLAKKSPGFVKSVVPANGSPAEQELFDKGLFQRLTITIQNSSLNQTFEFCFVPYNPPIVALSQLSSMAQNLWDSLI